MARNMMELVRRGRSGLPLLRMTSLFSTQQAVDPAAASLNQQGSHATQVIGRTPMVYLNEVTDGCHAQIAAKLGFLQPSLQREGQIAAKLDFLQPSFSVKDRPAVAMIEDAEKNEVMTPGKVVTLCFMSYPF